jgi:TonB family protein
MRVRSGILVLALSAIVAAPMSLPRKTFGQDAPTAEVAKRKIKSKVVPALPPLARETGITGKVRIEATISAEGKVTATKVVGGSPVLADAAIEALKKWRFEPAPKETTEIIEFVFNGTN